MGNDVGESGETEVAHNKKEEAEKKGTVSITIDAVLFYCFLQSKAPLASR